MNDPIELKRGYVDEDGKAHKKVTLRAPRMSDEIVAEREAQKAGFSAQSAYFECAIIRECITSWDGIADIKIDHVMGLNRLDAQTLRVELDRVEKQELAAQSSGNSSGGEPS